MGKSSGGGGRGGGVFSGTDAAFVRVTSSDRESVYESSNGLRVRFAKSGANQWATVEHIASGTTVARLNSSPIRSQRVVLDAARTLGRRVNWGRSAAQLNRALRSSADQRKMQDILWGAFPNVYR